MAILLNFDSKGSGDAANLGGDGLQTIFKCVYYLFSSISGFVFIISDFVSFQHLILLGSPVRLH